ncbi:hypothetical protein [Neptunicoccus cionae]|uniref:hypothetical protein n=1 Tax=Neptunicoccus cionae TaxID=2035344 RepID=UPI0016679BE8|nr:hypothetical protein [Amylibacter cionae]
MAVSIHFGLHKTIWSECQEKFCDVRGFAHFEVFFSPGSKVEISAFICGLIPEKSSTQNAKKTLGVFS